ncbi:MAG: AsmA family protein [Lentisphaeraceae bacterium]|nr:AsmA family protein [Lentisphaeraceae bacterium]
MKLLKGLWKFVRAVVLTVLILLAVLLIFAAAGGLGPLVKHVAPPVAKMFGVPLSIEKCVILPLGGYVRLEGVKVENPTTFVEAKPDVYGKTPLVSIGMVEADVGVRTLFSKELVIDSLQLTGLRALYAYDLETTNVDALIAQLPQGKAEPTVEPETEPPAEETPAGEAKQIRLAYVHFEDNSVSIRKFVTVPVPVPPLTLRDIDNHTFMERLMAIIAPVQKSIETLGSGASGLLDGVGSGLGALGEGAASLGTNAMDSVSSGLNALTSAETPEESKQAIEETKQELKSLGQGLKDALKKR